MFEYIKHSTAVHIAKSTFWSCYKGGERHCGTCGTCFERALSKLPHPGIPEHHLCRAIHILSDNPYLARAKSAVLLSVDELMIDIQVKGLLKNNFQDIINLFPAKE